MKNERVKHINDFMKITSFTLVIFVLFNCIGIYPFNKIKTFADNSKQIKVLEVEPGNNYYLSGFNNKTSSDGKYTLNITTMPMTQFIGDIKQINGYYDVVVIGNKISTNIKYTAVGDNVYSGGNFKDYSTGSTMNTKSGVVINNNGYQETGSENDITSKRAGNSRFLLSGQGQVSMDSGLASFIEAGQLAIFDQTIFSDTTLRNTNLYKDFVDYTNINSQYYKSNLISNVSVSSLTVDSIANYYYTNTNKQPSLNISSTPSQSDLSAKKLNFTFDMSSNVSSTNKLQAKLFVDMNGDGIFKPSEAFQQLQPTIGGQGFSISYSGFPDGFSGNVEWKLEITDINTNSKTYQTGYVIIPGNQPIIKVLQIVPGGHDANKNIVNKNTYSLKNNITQLNNSYCTINVTEVYAKDFSDSYANSSYKLYTTDGKTQVTNVLNGNYDMIILGFADSYGGDTTNGYSDINDPTARQAISNFIKSGQSVMFTHDTISDANNIFHNITGNTIGWGYYLQQSFRDIIGQSRYLDSNNSSGKNIDGSTIPHAAYPNSKPQYGYSYASLYNYTTTTQVHKFNDGLITQFPNTLSDLTVSQTHDQWYQLNLEDEDVVPWYTLSGTGLNSLNPRNYYYTYSKGNITFSGTGHAITSGSVTGDELKLFINTIYKATRGANHAPVVTLNLSKDQPVSKDQDKLNFSFSAYDPDGDTLSVNSFKVNSQNATAYYVDSNGNEQRFSGSISTNVPVNLYFKKSDLTNYLSSVNSNGGKFNVEVDVNDNKGATGTAVQELMYVTNPTISITSNVSDGYLVGDNASITLTATANNSTGANGTLSFTGSPNKLVLSGYDNTAINPTCDGWNDINNVNYVNGSSTSNSTQNKTINIQFLKPNDTGKPYTMNTSLDYSFNGITYNAAPPITLSVKSGTIDVSVLDQNNRVLPTTHARLKKADGTLVGTSTTNQSGIATFSNVPTGQYYVEVDAPYGYNVTSSQTGPISISFNNPYYKAQYSYAPVTLLAPVITSSASGWTSNNVTVTLTAPQQPSGVDVSNQKMQYQVDGGDWLNYNDTITIDTEGVHNFNARTYDSKLDMYSPSSTTTVKIDKTNPPDPTFTHIITDDNKALVTINYPDDNLSGLATKQYKIGSDGTWLDYTGQFTIDHNATIYAKSSDYAGNNSNEVNTNINDIQTIDPSYYDIKLPTNYKIVPVDSTFSFSADIIVGRNGEQAGPSCSVKLTLIDTGLYTDTKVKGESINGKSVTVHQGDAIAITGKNSGDVSLTFSVNTADGTLERTINIKVVPKAIYH